MNGVKLGHVALHAKDPATLAAFYANFLGLRETARVTTAETGPMVLMSGRPQEEFQELALLGKEEAKHVAFKVESLAHLRRLYADAVEQQVEVLLSFDHGVTLSFYFLDPEGNACEAYWETGRPPGGNRPIDLAKPESELLELIAGR